MQGSTLGWETTKTQHLWDLAFRLNLVSNPSLTLTFNETHFTSLGLSFLIYKMRLLTP